MKKKLAILLACMMMIVLIVSGCGNGDTEVDPDPGTEDPGTEDPGTEDPGSDDPAEEIELELWSIATESDAFNNAFNMAIADFEAANPGVTITHETYENESYKTSIVTSVHGNDLPDIFYTWGGGFSAPFVASGNVMSLEEYFTDEYSSQISDAGLSYATYDGELYGITYTTPISALFYNKVIFEENGVEPPTTFDELIEVCETLIDNGVTPIGISAADTWVLAMTHDNLALKAAGHEKVLSALEHGDASYNHPDFIEAAEKFQQLVDMGAFIDGASGMSNDEASAEFYEGRAAMFVTGSWMAGSIQTDPENPEDFDVAPYPVIGDNAASTDFMGAAADTLMVSESTEHPELAAEAAIELARSISKYSYLDGAGLPVWEVDYDDSEVNELTKKLADYVEGATSFTLWFDMLMEPEQAGDYLDLLEALYFGNITPEEFAERMDQQLN
ncbi:extracellular solute-binding protein [Herbivorax sp. ANBcel31]|uniref:ABC transporter substrate-binding protein n=1 Tax=Herbivorax sp. ANBcel31 TaxID=3069754 RepID=UPI0027B7A827|nr:extracellular solute-binding protein [Herbivorax sp. ANBcel31]MDQ2086059.1 extracellular solute-binding protein [Herbivorax sp. ANBcel31]